jgi:hypothetical protein
VPESSPGSIIVIDDDISRHGDLSAWIARLGLDPRIHAAPPIGQTGPGRARMVVIHGGFGRQKSDFPKPNRQAEAIHWFLDNPSYLFHEDLDGFAALGKCLGPSVPLIVMTGGSIRDIDGDALKALTGSRPIQIWNVIELLTTNSAEEVLAGPGHRRPSDTETTARLAAEIRHDLLNRLWNLVLVAGEPRATHTEIVEIIEGEADQHDLITLMNHASQLSGPTRQNAALAVETAWTGIIDQTLIQAMQRAIEELENR